MLNCSLTKWLKMCLHGPTLESLCIKGGPVVAHLAWMIHGTPQTQFLEFYIHNVRQQNSYESFYNFKTICTDTAIHGVIVDMDYSIGDVLTAVREECQVVIPQFSTEFIQPVLEIRFAASAAADSSTHIMEV